MYIFFSVNSVFQECFLYFSNHLGKSLQLLMDRVDEMSQDIVKYNTYLRNVSKQQQQKHQVGNWENLNEKTFSMKYGFGECYLRQMVLDLGLDLSKIKIFTETYPLSRVIKCYSKWGIIK